MKTKITVIAILAMALVMMIGCGLVSEVESIRLVNPPAASYKVGADVPVNNFMVEVKVGGQTMEWPLNDTRLTVEGLVNGKLDTATPGVKTIKITYMGVSITATYVVEGDSASNEAWTEENEFLAKLMGTENEITLAGNVNLAGRQWPAVDLTRNLTIDGANYTISGLTMTDASVFNTTYDKNGKVTAEVSNAGLFATVAEGFTLTIKNVKFDGVVIEQTSQYQGEFAKNFGVVVGYSKGNVVLDNVDVTNTTIKGNGRIGGLVGYAIDGSVEIKNCDVVATLVGYNPVAVTNDEGEADKIGGLVGMVNNKVPATFDTNTVKVIVNGTRDCGGLVGFVYNTSDLTFTDNQVLSGSIITLSVEGGMKQSKGKRHAGGIIGTWCFALYTNGTSKKVDGVDVIKGDMQPNGIYSFEGNVVAADVVIAVNAKYSESSWSRTIGGYRAWDATKNPHNIEQYDFTVAELAA